ncbi:hypothetical protein BV898_11651 [Hypsibius exemplaris]|uniref:Uncharacterized protein n=1 Tax=Hypsibius exemplaris TaxID=2072580 RepID=A0A1W0WG51_HYPEX|nr:hypothetical protein BV898_11651 [Hypsibius exemplaris]
MVIHYYLGDETTELSEKSPWLMGSRDSSPREGLRKSESGLAMAGLEYRFVPTPNAETSSYCFTKLKYVPQPSLQFTLYDEPAETYTEVDLRCGARRSTSFRGPSSSTTVTRIPSVKKQVNVARRCSFILPGDLSHLCLVGGPVLVSGPSDLVSAINVLVSGSMSWSPNQSGLVLRPTGWSRQVAWSLGVCANVLGLRTKYLVSGQGVNVDLSCQSAADRRRDRLWKTPAEAEAVHHSAGHNGYGSEEDHLRNCAMLVPKPTRPLPTSEILLLDWSYGGTSTVKMPSRNRTFRTPRYIQAEDLSVGGEFQFSGHAFIIVEWTNISKTFDFEKYFGKVVPSRSYRNFLLDVQD